MNHPSPSTPAGTSPGQTRRAGFFIDLAVLTGAALLFALSFPSFVSEKGWWPLAYLALTPVFLVVSRSALWAAPLYGAYYGFVSYALFNFWLLKFHPLAIFIVPTIYVVNFLVYFPLLRMAARLFPRRGYLVQVLIWIAYELLRTKGFLGYSYGIMGYSQYLFPTLLGIADLLGVWGVSVLVVFPSAYLAAALSRGPKGLPAFFRTHRIDAALYAGAFILVLLYGRLGAVDLREAKIFRPALIQHNVDPWKGGVRAYRENLDRLVALSQRALGEDPDLLVWSETAFVPGIDWHSRYRENPDIYALVDELMGFLAGTGKPVLLGNDDGRLEKDRFGVTTRVDYNAALLYDRGRISGIYRKTRLVPFTEHFPYEKTFPWFYRKLVEADTHFWEKGRDYVVFQAGGVKFSTPICFEDSFGYISREFVRGGAEIIVNITNDSWSYSVAAAMQHLAMSVLRAVENRRSVVRGTNGGMTAVIDPNGRIIQLYPPFREGYLLGRVPVYTASGALYTAWGDWFAWLCVFSSAAALAGGAVRKSFRRRNAIDITGQV